MPAAFSKSPSAASYAWSSCWAKPRNKIEPDKIGPLRQAGAQKGAGLGGPLLPQQTKRVQILCPEMARLALEHPIKFLDRRRKLLATIKLVSHQKMVEHAVGGRALGRLLRSGRLGISSSKLRYRPRRK